MSTENIDPDTRIHPDAKIHQTARIGPWCVIGPNVEIGAGTVLESNVVIRCNTKIGENNHFYQFSSVGEDPADKKFKGEETWLEIGDNNVIRECATVHRGTGAGVGITRIGSNNLLMAYIHVAHDCVVGDNVILANHAALAGHVVAKDWVTLGGFAGVNQFLTIGAHAYVGGLTHISHDVPPYMIVSGIPETARSINTIGLQRRGFTKETIGDLREAFKVIYRRNYSLQEAIDQLKVMQGSRKELDLLVQSLEAAREKGIAR